MDLALHSHEKTIHRKWIMKNDRQCEDIYWMIWNEWYMSLEEKIDEYKSE